MIWFKEFSNPWKPDSHFIMCEKIILLITILVQTYLAPFIDSFVPSYDINFGDAFIMVGFICDLYFALDILLTFHISYYNQGELISETKTIAIHYLKTSFIPDVISLLSLIGYMSEGSKDFILLSLLRLHQLPALASRIEDYFQFSRQFGSFFQLIKLVVFVLIVAHFISCIQYIIIKDDLASSWLSLANVDTGTTFDRYVASLYWSIATMATVGFGDIYPTNTKERLTTICVMIVSSIVFGYILSSIGSLLMEMSNYSNESRYFTFVYYNFVERK